MAASKKVKQVVAEKGHVTRRHVFFLMLWFFAIIMSATLIISSEFVYNNPILKAWTVILVILYFIKLTYDTTKNMQKY